MSAIAEKYFTNLGGLSELPELLQMDFTSEHPTGIPGDTAWVRLTLLLEGERYAVVYNNPAYEVPRGEQAFNVVLPLRTLTVNDVATGTAVPLLDYVDAETPYLLILQAWEDGEGWAMSGEVGDVVDDGDMVGEVSAAGDALFSFTKTSTGGGFQVLTPAQNLGVVSVPEPVRFELLK